MRRVAVKCVLAGITALLAAPGVALAQPAQAFTTAPVNLRAGPAPDYPVVAQLSGGVPLTVMGCVSQYTWCDVALPNLRGWVYAGQLGYAYQGGSVPVLNYGTVIGLPIITFSIGAYWGNYYRGRPWYHDQGRWAHRPPYGPGPGYPPVHVRPPGGHPPGRPPGHASGGSHGGGGHGGGGSHGGGGGGGHGGGGHGGGGGGSHGGHGGR